MSRGYSRTVFVVILSIFIPFFIISITVNQASAFPGKGSGGLGFDPAGDSEGAQCLNLFQIDLNELYNVSEPFVNRACHEVGSGGFYVANNHVIVNSEYPETLRQELEASGYHFLGNTPL